VLTGKVGPVLSAWNGQFPRFCFLSDLSSAITLNDFVILLLSCLHLGLECMIFEGESRALQSPIKLFFCLLCLSRNTDAREGNGHGMRIQQKKSFEKDSLKIFIALF
jgi:hypothetical protein